MVCRNSSLTDSLVGTHMAVPSCPFPFPLKDTLSWCSFCKTSSIDSHKYSHEHAWRLGWLLQVTCYIEALLVYPNIHTCHDVTIHYTTRLNWQTYSHFNASVHILVVIWHVVCPHKLIAILLCTLEGSIGARVGQRTLGSSSQIDLTTS
jgi:hypothetical protein